MKKILLTKEETRLWVEWKLNPNNQACNMVIQYKLLNTININRLNSALSTAETIFDAFRSYFIEEEGVPYRVILPPNGLSIKFIDLTQDKLEFSNLDEVLNYRRIKLFKTPFDLTKLRLFRCELIKVTKNTYYFIFVMPHILCDVYSIDLFLDVVSHVYNSESNSVNIINKYRNLIEHASSNPEKLIEKRSYLEAENYWKNKFYGTQCQINFNVLKKYIFKKSNPLWLTLPINLISGLRKLSSDENTSLFSIFSAAISIFLYRYFGEEDISLGYPANIRPDRKGSKQFGFFINELGLRIQLSGALSFRDTLTSIVQQRFKDRNYQTYPLIEVLLKKIRVDNPNLSFPFNVRLIHTSLSGKMLKLKDITIEENNLFYYGQVKTDLSFLYDDRGDSKNFLEFAIDYNSAIFDADFMQRMSLNFIQFLEEVIAYPVRSIDQLSILTEKERHQLLIEWNQTARPYPEDKMLHELFEEQVKIVPDAIALVFGEQELTYHELNERANQLGRYLRTLGVRPGNLIAICLEPCLEMVVVILGILKAGGGYVPLDPEYPEKRFQFILEDIRAAALITCSNLKGKFFKPSLPFIIIDNENFGLKQQSTNNLTRLSTSKNLAYVIYTSGSTGKPKGVKIAHQAVVNHMICMQKELNFSHLDIVLLTAPLVFDPSVCDIFLTLLSGAKLVILSSNARKDPQQLVEYVTRHKVTIFHLVPLLLNEFLLQERVKLCQSIRCMLVGGESLLKEIKQLFFSHFPSRQLVNSYGPTETTISSTFYNVTPDESNIAIDIIGKPFWNTKLYILDKRHQLLPIGVIGELYVGGDCLAVGYLNRPELTKEKFIDNPFVNEKDKRQGRNLHLYRTGDLVRYLPDGNIEYVGRKDYQVKIHGYRIELEEIEATLRQVENVKEAAVLAREDIPGQKCLVAYVVLNNKPLKNSEEAEQVMFIRQYLEQQLPAYMVPNSFMSLERMPLATSGKLARQELPIPNKLYRVEGYIAPRTVLEKQLVKIWSELLGVSEISINDNFFRIGGHSLMAMRLMGLIKEEFAKVVSLAYFFKYPTIKGLIDCLSKNNLALIDDLLPIQTKGNLPPLFLIHPASGVAVCYYSLFLDNLEQPLYGISNPYFNSHTKGFSNLEEMASTYIDMIKMVQTTGPYRLGGWSFGGVVAFEMAKQLQDRGQQVEIVILIDSDAYPREVLNHKSRLTEVSKINLSVLEDEYIEKEFKNASKMLEHYKLSPYMQRVILLKACEESKEGDIKQFCNGWEAFLPKLEVYSIPGQHSSLFDKDSLQPLSEKLNEILSVPKPAIFSSEKNTFLEKQILAAAARNDYLIIKFLLKAQGFNVNTKDHLGRTLLHWASYHLNLKLVEILLEQKAKISLADKEGNTPFILAKNKELVEVGDKEIEIANQLEKMGYIQYKAEIDEKLKKQKNRTAICHLFKRAINVLND